MIYTRFSVWLARYLATLVAKCFGNLPSYHNYTSERKRHEEATFHLFLYYLFLCFLFQFQFRFCHTFSMFIKDTRRSGMSVYNVHTSAIRNRMVKLSYHDFGRRLYKFNYTQNTFTASIFVFFFIFFNKFSVCSIVHMRDRRYNSSAETHLWQ